MSDDPQRGADTPRDPWGNPLPPEDRPPAQPRPDDYPPTFPNEPAGGPPPGEGANPAWPGRQDHDAPPPGGSSPGWGTPPGGTGPGWGAPPGEPPGGAPGGAPGAGGPPQTWGAPPQGWQAPPGQPGWTPHPWAAPKTEGMAIGGFVCSLVGILVCGIVLEPVAIVLGIMARKRIRESNGALKGDGLAIAAIVIGIIGVVLTVIGIAVLVANPDLMDDLFDTSST